MIEKNTQAIEKRLLEEPHEMMLIENNTEIEGFIGLAVGDEDVNPLQVAEICTVYFNEKYYGNDNAQMLMGHVLALLHQQIQEVIL